MTDSATESRELRTLPNPTAVGPANMPRQQSC